MRRLRWFLLLCLALTAPASQAGVLMLGGSGQSAAGGGCGTTCFRVGFE